MPIDATPPDPLIAKHHGRGEVDQVAWSKALDRMSSQHTVELRVIDGELWERMEIRNTSGQLLGRLYVNIDTGVTLLDPVSPAA